MAETQAPSAQIRPFEDKDLDSIRYFVGSDIMESIPSANKAIFFTPQGAVTTLALGILLTFITGLTPYIPTFERLNWGAVTLDLFRALLSTAPYLGAAFIILAVAEIQHRSIFERALQRRLTQEDMRDIRKYYSSAPASGFYVLDYSGKVIGCIALDASRPTDTLQPLAEGQTTAVAAKSGSELKKRKSTKAASAVDNTENVLLIRTFVVSAVYRPAGVEEDLLRFALTKAFSGTSPIQKVEIAVRPQTHARKIKLLDKFGLRQLQGQQATDAELTAVPKGEKVALFIPSDALSKIWPIKLGSKVYGIDRTQWKAHQK